MPHRRPLEVTMTRKRGGLGRLLRLAGWGLAAAALAQELRKPPRRRTWQGTVGGFVPYDFRFPTLERVRSAVWNPDDPSLLKPQPFGVGWTLNAGRVIELVRKAR
jgi:hypothetical protein